MPDILPPQLVGVQQRPLYVKVRTIVTVVASIWMVLAITGFGFFSGGTTSLALSLVLLYGTGAALIVVLFAVYRLVNRSAVKRAEAAPEDTKAVVFVDTARSATEELLAALRPSAATGLPQYVPGATRTVRPASATETAAAKGAGAAASVPAAKQPAASQAKTTMKASPKSALNKAVPNKSGKSAAAKSAVAKSVSSKSAKGTAAKPAPAKGAKTPAKIPPAKASQAKGRPANNNGSKSTPAKRSGSSAERSTGKKQPSAKDSGPGAGGQAVSMRHTVRSVSAKSPRPVLVLASSNSVPQPSRQHIPDSRKRAS